MSEKFTLTVLILISSFCLAFMSVIPSKQNDAGDVVQAEEFNDILNIMSPLARNMLLTSQERASPDVLYNDKITEKSLTLNANAIITDKSYHHLRSTDDFLPVQSSNGPDDFALLLRQKKSSLSRGRSELEHNYVENDLLDKLDEDSAIENVMYENGVKDKKDQNLPSPFPSVKVITLNKTLYINDTDSMLPEFEPIKLPETLEEYDKNADGLIEIDELREITGFAERTNEAFAAADINEDGYIDKDEYSAAMWNAPVIEPPLSQSIEFIPAEEIRPSENPRGTESDKNTEDFTS